MNTPQIRDRTALRAPTQQCTAIGCTRSATQTATSTFYGDGRIALCDMDAAYMASVPRYRTPGWGTHRNSSLDDEQPTTETVARDLVEQHVLRLLDDEDPLPDGLIDRTIDALLRA